MQSIILIIVGIVIGSISTHLYYRNKILYKSGTGKIKIHNSIYITDVYKHPLFGSFGPLGSEAYIINVELDDYNIPYKFARAKWEVVKNAPGEQNTSRYVIEYWD